MSTSTAIGMVSESLLNLLTGEMRLSPPVKVTILAPDEGGEQKRINLFLYKVQENPSLKNIDWRVKKGDPTQLVPPPLSLNLFYLMTSYAQSDPQTGNSTAHSIMGEAMRVFYENPVVPQNYLVSGLKNAGEQIKIILYNPDMWELSTVWSTFGQPFRTSVLYEVSVVQLDMLTQSERAMARRVRQIGVPDVRAPFNPPVVEGMEPMVGPAMTSITITFYGKNLLGWKAYVTVTGRLILDQYDLKEDMFQVTLPQDLQPGFHEIRVDISHLFRKTFFLEVTA